MADPLIQIAAPSTGATVGNTITPVPTNPASVPLVNTQPRVLDERLQNVYATAAAKTQFSGSGGLAGVVDDTPAPVGDGYITSTGDIYSEPDRNSNVLTSLTKGIALLPVAAADTIGRSVGLWGDDSVVNWFNSSGMGDTGSFYARNKQVLSATADIATFAIPGTLAVKGLETASRAVAAGKFGEMMKNSTAVAALIGNGQKFSDTMAVVREATVYKAGSEGYLAGKNYGAALSSVFSAAKGTSATFDAVKSRAILGSALNGVRKGIAFELGAYGAMRDSETLYPKENSTFDNLKWAAIGPVLGGIGEFASSRYAIRQMINGVTKNVNAAADTAGISQAMLNMTFRPGERGVGITTFGIQKAGVQHEMGRAADQALRDNLQSEISIYDNVLKTQFGEAAKDRNVLLNRGYELDDSQSALLLKVAADKPTAFVGVAKLDELPNIPADEFLAGTTKKINAIVKQGNDLLTATKPGEFVPGEASKKAQELFDQASQLRDMQFHVVENTGEISNLAVRPPRWLDTHTFEDIQKVGDAPNETSYFKINDDRLPNSMAIDENFIPYSGPSKTLIDEGNQIKTAGFDLMPAAGRSALFAGYSKAIKAWTPAIASKANYVASADLPWPALEAYSTLLKTKPEFAQFIKWTPEIPDAKALDLTILDQKYSNYLDLLKHRDMTASLTKKTLPEYTQEGILNQLNLPHQVAGQDHPLIEFFSQLQLQGDTSLKNALENSRAKQVFAAQGLAYDDIPAIDKVQRFLQKTVQWPEITEFMGRDLSLTGELFKQTEAKPVLAMMRPVGELGQTAKSLIEAAQTTRASQLAGLVAAEQNGAPLVGMISNAVLGSGAYKVATQVEEIREGVATSRGIVTDQGRVLEQHPVTDARNAISATKTHITNAYIEAVMTPIKPVLAEIFAAKNATQLFELNQIEHAYRYGWELTGEVNEGRFVLAQTDTNKKLWARLAEENKWDLDELPEEAYMPNMTRGALKSQVDLKVSELAAATAQNLSAISRNIGEQTNYLRKRAGLPPIKLRDFHLPTPDMSDKARVVILNERGERVNIYTGVTQQEAEAKASHAMAIYRKENPGRQYTKQSWDTVAQYKNSYEDDFQKFIDYSDQINQTGKANTGGWFVPEVTIGPDPLKNMVNSIGKSYYDLANRTDALIFEPQINYAKQAHVANATGSDVAKSGQLDIWERYINTIYGGQTLQARSGLGKLNGAADSFYDQITRALYDKYLGNFSRAAAGAGGPRSAKSFFTPEDENTYKKLAKELTFDPFGSTQKFLQDTYRVAPPAGLKGALARANGITAAMTFRLLDSGTALMNLGSLMTTWAPVIKSMQRMHGEELADWGNRIGAWGVKITPEIAAFNSNKALSTAAHAFFDPENVAAMGRATKMGYFTPEAHAMHEAFVAPIESLNAAKFNKFMDGASYLADKSEELSRKMSFSMGYQIAKKHFLMEDDANAFMFAHKVMTEMIGDYRAVNRPQMFQGSLGIPLGLFQTYMINYYRRLYSYVERKDYRALAVQYATQASLYGAQTVPGFDVYNAAFADNYDGTSNPIDNFRKKFGEETGDWFFYGSLSNIPKYLGAGGGIAFYPRANTNLSAPPTAATLQNAPVFQAAKTVFQGVMATADMFSKGGQFSKGQMLEILSHYSLNRTAKSIFELAAGEKTDRSGAVIENDTRDLLGIIARTLGATKMTTQKLQETYMRQTGTDQSQTAIRQRMASSFRAMARDGSLSVDAMQDMARSYLESGGSPQYFAAWMRQNLIVAKASKFDRKYNELLNSNKGQEFTRFMSILQPDLTTDGE